MDNSKFGQSAAEGYQRDHMEGFGIINNEWSKEYWFHQMMSSLITQPLIVNEAKSRHVVTPQNRWC